MSGTTMREIYQVNIEEAISRRDSSEDMNEKYYWDFIASCLLADLKAYEEELHWSRQSRSIPDINEVIERFFKGFYEF